jgi:hypothetical protein
MRNGAPLLAITLAGLNVTIIRAGDSLRSYGLGSALAVLALAFIWRLTCRPSLAAFCCAVVVAVSTRFTKMRFLYSRRAAADLCCAPWNGDGVTRFWFSL